jgi:tRNA-2-methylthio-N6-dimethylallyladenosine synthase
MRHARYDYGFMFAYSERPGTMAGRKMDDDIPLDIKKRRLQEVIDLQREIGFKKLQQQVGNLSEVLIEKSSKKSDAHWAGRNTQNNMVIFPKTGRFKPGDFVNILITKCTTATLLGDAVGFSENN